MPHLRYLPRRCCNLRMRTASQACTALAARYYSSMLVTPASCQLPWSSTARVALPPSAARCVLHNRLINSSKAPVGSQLRLQRCVCA
jgi:hypothetical protein